MVSFASISLMALTVIRSVSAVDQVADPELVKNIRNAATRLEVLNMTGDAEWTYDFSTNPKCSDRFKPGAVCNANAATFPLLTGLGMTVAQLNLGPCAMLPPHLHRATNLVVSAVGTTHTYMIQENGARTIETHLSPGQMTIFPAASLHTMVNEGCEDNVLYSFLNSEDPGTLNIANQFWQFGAGIGNRIMPMLNITAEDWNQYGEQIPPVGTGSNSGFGECLQKCGLSTRK